MFLDRLVKQTQQNEDLGSTQGIMSVTFIFVN